MSISPALRRYLSIFAPILFVLLWSTGFVGSKMSMPHAEPFTFLSIRFGLTSIGFFALIMIMRVKLPRDPVVWLHTAIVGLLMHGVYLGGVFFAVDRGTSAGIAALIVGVQPVLTAILAGLLLNERLSFRAWLGLALGFCGVALVVWRQAGDTGGTIGVAACASSLLAITVATLYQKRFAGKIDLRVGSALQFAAAAALMWAIAVPTETMVIDWNAESIFAMAWLVIVLSFGAVTLLYILIREGAASKVASLFYLVPPVVAVEGYFLFDEVLSLGALAGMVIAVIGVALVTRG
ncbi:MAG: DMT family transporter [Rhodospirillales bacterium]|nr:DMT family transporter [Rhodospirillales bacterium]MBO6785327.1 DMT family transporter [Rhodospirillales bacterium]